ncbi:MAG: hypothetical protein EOO08_02675 [Chitinophagaceae bacterium]|nr:MAG: hypothetical protein EOO08_02675 [Chitinophagaceae bacterium]
MDTEMEAQLWAYIDGIATESEQSAIERLLAENADWRARYAELLENHQLLGAGELEQPSMRFTRNVMEAIAAGQIVPATRQYLNNRIIGGIGLFFGALILTVLVLAFSSSDGGGSGTSSLPSFNVNKLFGSSSVNIFLMANIVLALLLIDRLLTARRRGRLDRGHS